MTHFNLQTRIASTLSIAACGALAIACSGSGVAGDGAFDELGEEPSFASTEAESASADEASDSDPTTIEAMGRERQLGNPAQVQLSGVIQDATLSGAVPGAWVCVGEGDDERCAMTDVNGAYEIGGASFGAGAALSIERSGFLTTRQAAAPTLGGMFSETYLVFEDDVDGGLAEGTGAVLVKLHRMQDLDWTPVQDARVEVDDHDVLYANADARFELGEGTGAEGFALVADVEAGELTLASDSVIGATCSFFDGGVFSDALTVEVEPGSVTLVYADCE